jgi:hypothetical protein
MSRDQHFDRLSITLSQDSKRAQDASVRDLGLAGVVAYTSSLPAATGA